jgi:hypothetical protein
MADEKDEPPSATAPMPRVRRRAPTIDLKATEVAVEPQASAPADSPVPSAERESEAPPEYSTQPPAYETGAEVPAADASPPDGSAPSPESSPSWPRHAPPRPASGRSIVEGGLAGGLVALLLLTALWLAGMFSGNGGPPDPRLAALESRVRDLASRPAPRNVESGTIEELKARLARLENAAPRADASTAGGSGFEEAIKPLQTAVADLTRRVDDNAGAMREARGQADAAAAGANAARAAAERNNTDALGKRVATLEGTAKSLSDDVAKSLAASGDRPLRASVAAQALRASVERGESFAAELSAAKTLAPDPQLLAPLEPFAAGGLPSAAALARQLADLAPAMLKAAPAPIPSGGFLDRLQANAEKLVRVRPIAETSGDEPAAVVARAQAKAARSDLAGAVAELNSLPGNVRAPAEDWIKKVEARNAALAASRRFVTDALAALGKASP